MSASVPDDPLRVTGAELRERLERELALTDWRSVIVIVVAGPGLEEHADTACVDALRRANIPDEKVLRWVVRRDGKGREQLRAYNRARDNLLADSRLIYLRASSAADVRFLHELAPDLTAAVDVFAELSDQSQSQSQRDWTECSRALRALMDDRHRSLDFTGLLPASVEQRILSLDALYQPLVDLRFETNPLEATQPGTGWLVLGHPGTGKTTFVRHLAWTYARDRSDPLEIGPKLPLLLSLSDYGYEREHDRVRSLVEFLPRWLAEQQVPGAAALTDNLPELLLLLDGLDELRSGETRRAVLAEVGDLAREARVGGVVITGRSFLVDELRKQDHALRIVATLPPTPEQMRAFVQTFVRLRRRSDVHAERLVATIQADSDLRALARTPLMLAFMVILDELEGRLPDRRIEIYYRLGEMLVDRWTRARSIGANAARRERPTRAEALRVVGPLAWWALERGGGAVPEQSLLRELEQLEARREVPAEARRRAAALLELLRSDTALLVPLPGQRWRFVHQSIGEYFAGIEAERDHNRWEKLLANPFRAEWREVVLFCAGQLGMIEGRMERLDRLIQAILAKSRRAGRYDAKYASLIMGLLSESPGLSRRQVDRLVARLLDFVFKTAYSRAAKLQVQREFVSLLQSARGSVRDSLRTALGELLSTRVGSVQWDRVLEEPAGDHLPRLLQHESFSVRLVATVFLGPVITTMDSWVADYGVDLRPTLARWTTQRNWVYRLAAWWLTSAPVDRELPFAEVAEQLTADPEVGDARTREQS